MKRLYPALFLALVLVFVIPASADPLPARGKIVNIRSLYIGPAGAYHFLPVASLNAQLSTFGLKSGFGNAISVGLDYSRHYSVNRYDAGSCSYWSIQWYLPQTVKSDSLTFTLRGYDAQFDIFNLDFVQSQKATFTVGLAWAFGRMKMVEEDKSGNSSSFYTTYFCPQLRSELSFRLGKHVFIGARYSYRHDFTKTGWKQTGAPRPALTGTRFSGTTVAAFIGFGY